MRDSGIGTAKEPWQKVYRLIVKGGKSIAHVRVRIYFDDEDELGNIEIERIDLQT